MKIKLSLLPLILLASVSAQAMTNYQIAQTESLAWVLRNEAVMSEVKLRRDQAEKATSVFKNYDEKSDALWRETEGKTDAEAEKILVQIDKLGDQLASNIFEILDETQAVRLEQIRLQRESFFALREGNLGKALQITVNQAEKIEALYNTYSKRTEEARAENQARNGGRINFAELRAARQKLRETASVDFFMVLTFEQRKQYTRIVGKPYLPHNSAGSK